MPTLYLIDGYAQFFRAYHAIRTPLTSPVTKEPTNMTFGFVGMLLKLLRGEGRIGGKPDYIAVTLDVSGDRGTFRSQLYPQYKANRSEPPSDLEVQVERCLSMLRDAGIPILGAEGFEADDVMATLVSRLRASHPDLTIRLISKDKDLKQLLRGEPARQARRAVRRPHRYALRRDRPAQRARPVARAGHRHAHADGRHRGQRAGRRGRGREDRRGAAQGVVHAREPARARFGNQGQARRETARSRAASAALARAGHAAHRRAGGA